MGRPSTRPATPNMPKSGATESIESAKATPVTVYDNLSFYTRELIVPVLFLATLSPLCFSLISLPSSIALIVFLVSFPHLARCISPHLMSTSMLDALNIRAGATLSLCAGITALILQTHNPQIAFAVYRHSDLRSRPLTRLLRTFLFVELAVNGTAQEKEQIASWLRWLHRGVYGSLPPQLQQTLGMGGADAEYGYIDELKAYVLQTLTWSTIEFCNRFGRRLDKRGLENIVLQYTCIGYQLGVPPALLAKDFATFSTQFKSRLQRIPPPHLAGGDVRRESFIGLEHTTLVAGTSWTIQLLLRCAFLIGHDLLPPEVQGAYRPQMLQGRIARITQRLLLFFLWLLYPCLPWLPLRGVIALICVLEPAVRNTVQSSLHAIHSMDVAIDKPVFHLGDAELTATGGGVPSYVHWLSSGNEIFAGKQPFLQVFLTRVLGAQTSGKCTFQDWVLLLATASVDFLRMLLSESALWVSKRRAEFVVGRIVKSHGRDNSPPSFPRHVGCIMDGNRRYARSQHKAVAVGHAQGAVVAVRLLGWWLDSLAYLPAGPRVLTLWAFSSDNFKRSPGEVQTLLRLMTAEFTALAFSSLVHLARMRVRVIGSRAQFPAELVRAIELLEDKTVMYSELQMQLAVGYGGREEVIDSVSRVLSRGEAITESAITRETYCARNGLPPVDLILRTSEHRTSGFLLWDTQAAELHFIDKLWPELNQLDWLWALESSSQREQRHGT